MTDAFEEQLSLVKELQDIDLDLHKFQTTLDELPQKIEELETAYNTAKNELLTVKNELAEVEKAKRNDELDLAASVDYLRNREAKLYAIKTNKEYQAALKEISEGKRINREREDRVLAAMEKIEQLTQKTTQLNSEFADKEVAYRKKLEDVGAEKQKILDEMESKEAKRPMVAERLDKKIIRKYEFVRQRYASAAAGVTDGICQGCSTRIPPQLFNEMLRRDELKSCPSCQRLIYVVEKQADENKNGGESK